MNKADSPTTPVEELTFDQQYQIPFEVRFGDSEKPIAVQYAGCGSHQIDVSGVIDLWQAREIRDRLNALPGIDGGDL